MFNPGDSDLIDIIRYQNHNRMNMAKSWVIYLLQSLTVWAC